ncbi:hypothetical protein [Streptomyces sp. NPDC002537]
MSDLDFYVRAATRCDILGAGVHAEPGAWEAVLGEGFVDPGGGSAYQVQYGLVDVSFAPGADGPDSCFGFGVKPHRLIHGDADTVPRALVREYGAFARRVRFEELRAGIEAQGMTVEAEDEQHDMCRYRVVETGARIHAVVDPCPYGHGDHDPDDPEEQQAGDVWSIDVLPAWWG